VDVADADQVGESRPVRVIVRAGLTPESTGVDPFSVVVIVL
jgi:hypothetical protein